MSQLSKYIQKQLATILNKIQQTPPKRCSSMHKIKTLVSQAPISQTQKSTINNSIRKIETAMTGQRKQSRKKLKSQYTRNLFYQNMFLQQKNMNKVVKQHQQQGKQEDGEYIALLEKIQEVRSARLKRQEYLNQLILKTQRLKRLISLKQENQDKYLKSKMLASDCEERKNRQEEIRNQIRDAVKSNKIRAVYTLVSKYNNYIK